MVLAPIHRALVSIPSLNTFSGTGLPSHNLSTQEAEGLEIQGRTGLWSKSEGKATLENKIKEKDGEK